MMKILFVLTSHDRIGETGMPTGFYLPEAAHPWSILRAAGFEIDFVSPKGGQPPMDGAGITDAASISFLDDEEVSQTISNKPTPDQVNAAHYAAIFYVGGHGTMWDFPDNQTLIHIAAAIYESGGIVDAVRMSRPRS